MAIKEYVLKEKDYLIEMRRHFHAHPEVSLKEYETCNRIEAELDRFDIPYKRVGETAIYGWIDGKKPGEGKVIGLRADIDALAMQDLKTTDYCSKNDGVCHACGHDAHTATLLTAAKILKEKEASFAGQVRLFFQPAEEIGQGARIFVEAGLLEGVERIFGAHISSNLESGKVALTKGPQNASCDYFKIEITGRGTHVSTPHHGIDTAYIASQIVVNLQSIVSRSTAPLETVVVGIGVIKAGTQYNIVAEHAMIEGTTRSFLPDVRKATNDKVTKIAKDTAAMYGATAEVTFLDFAAPLVNDADAVEEVRKIAESIIGKENMVSDFAKTLGADDYADYLAVTKGMYAFIGTRNEALPNTTVTQHHGMFDLDEEALLASCNLYVDYALEVLQIQ